MMGLTELHYYDLYAPLVGSVDLAYTPEEAQKHVLAALAPLGPEYTACCSARSTNAGSISFRTQASGPGAYSSGGAYDVHPYILMNYNGKYDDMSTMAHELGHTMHSYFSNKTQPYPLAWLPDVRRRGRVDVQRVAAHRSHAQDD